MQLLIFVTVTLAILAPWANASCDLSREEFVSKFCSADIVFKGVPAHGQSSTSVGENGEQIESARFTFRVSQSFRDTNGNLDSLVEVVRIYNPLTDSGNCGPAFLPESASAIIIFATRGATLTVPACGGAVDWICAPDDIETITCGK